MTLRIGVTGHRWNKLPPSSATSLATRLRAALVALRDPAEVCTLVCGMAEGTDMIAASVMPPSWTLEAALALPVPQWRDHLRSNPDGRPGDIDSFDRLTQRAQIRTKGGPHQAPDYPWVGQHIAQTCTVLIAVWDGKPGGSGGTSDVIEMARARGIKVIILPPEA